MKTQHVYFILPPRVLLLDLAGPAEAFWMANRYQRDVRFQLHYAGAEENIRSSIGLGSAKSPAFRRVFSATP